MRYGVTCFVTDQSIDVVTLARACEERGLDSLWLPEHTHIPTSRRSPWPVNPGAPIDEKYKRCIDPLVGLGAAAVATTRLRLGTAILLVAQRDPIVGAKEVATVDLLSGGRLTLGVGFGWNEEEMNDHGVLFSARREHGRDHVLAMRRLWEDDEAFYEGPHVSFEPSWSWPKPVQRPLPVLVGGMAGPKLFNHIAEYAQGWIPIGGTGLREAIPRLRDVMADAGRDPSQLEVVPSTVVPDPGKLDFYESIGVTEVAIGLSTAPAEVVLKELDTFAEMIEGRQRDR